MNLEKMKKRISVNQGALKRAKIAAKANPEDKAKTKVVKIFETKLKNSRAAYKKAKPKSKIRQQIDKTAETVQNGAKTAKAKVQDSAKAVNETAKRFSLKRIISWNFAVPVAFVTTVAAAVATYIWLKDEEPAL